ncbi:HAD-IA family hydrolase [Thiotrichales bacterium 19S3-7]|nr:HAD-IA family hydrolase [Thiotrichales bacterium 19S3-7]MCF6800917.1 HAD-IA family hydrolase [Thiotrichales bacterium 19S3-11]
MLTTSWPLKSKVKGVFFDLDGTLEDTAGGILATVKYVCAQFDIPYAGDETLRPYAGEGLVYLMRLCQSDLDDEILQQGFMSGLIYYREEGYRHNHPFPGVKDVLALLEQQGIAWGIVTNKVRSIIKPSLDNLPRLPQSELIICQDDLPRHKPDPLPLEEICQRCGILPNEALFVGDSLNDMKAANAAGLYGVFVTYGYGNCNQLKASGIKSGIINHLDELKTWLISTN